MVYDYYTYWEGQDTMVQYGSKVKKKKKWAKIFIAVCPRIFVACSITVLDTLTESLFLSAAIKEIRQD